MSNSAFVYLTSFISLLGLVVLVFWLYRQLVLDRFRQELFALRDSWFDEARNGSLDFESEAYRTLRQTMNGLIRFGHRMNMPSALMLLAVCQDDMKQVGDSFSHRMSEAMSSLSEEQRDLTEEYRTRMNFITMEYLLLSSPLFNITLVIPAIIVALFRALSSREESVVRVARTPLNRLDSAAYAYAKG